MAVESHHLTLFPSSQCVSNRDLLNTNRRNTNMFNTQMMDRSVVNVLVQNQQSLVNHSVLGKMLVKKSDSGVTFNPQEHQPRKRPRESFDHEFNVGQKLDFPSPLFHGQDGINLQMQIQQLEMDRIISQHAEKLKMEIEQRKKRQFRQFVTAIESGVVKKLKEKAEQVQKMSKMNYLLQERIKTLFLENQLWREMAQSNEATANSLRNNLEQVIMAHGSGDQAVGDGNDAESCCDSNEKCTEGEGVRRLREEEEVKDKEMVVGKMCRKCEERESCVLMLPCRHLCLCTLCGSTVYTCPLCNSNLTATLHVNMSS